MNSQSKLINAVLYILSAYIILLPLVFLTSITDQFQLPKTHLTLLTATILVVVYTIASINRKRFDVNLKVGYLPVLLLGLAYTVSSLLQSDNAVQAFTERTILILSLTIIYLISTSVLTKSNLMILFYSFIVGSVLSSAINIFTISTNNNPVWSTTGSPTSYLVLIALAISLSLGLAIYSKQTASKVFILSLVAFNIGVGIFVLFRLFSGQVGFINLPYSMGYQVALDILKHPRSALLGVGPENFLPAFTILRPRSYNELSNMWSLRPAYSSNELFHTMTITGILGTTALVLMMLFLIKNILTKWHTEQALAFVNIVTLLSLLIIPANTTILALFFIVFIFNSLSDYNTPLVSIKSPALSSIIGVVLIIITGFGIYHLSKFILADYYYRQALTPESKERFQLIKKAQLNNPYNSNYFVAYANLSIELAERLSKKDPAQVQAEDREVIKKLIEEAIPNINRAALRLNQENPAVWESRGRIMRRISTVVPAATQQAINSYTYALALDGKNPTLYVEFGQYLQSLKLYDLAERQFENAANLKTGYANPLFNLAILYFDQKEYPKANEAIKRTITLIPSSDQENYNRATELQKQIQEQLSKQTPKEPVTPITDQLQPGSLEATQSSQINVLDTTPLPPTDSVLPIPSITPPVVVNTPTPSAQ